MVSKRGRPKKVNNKSGNLNVRITKEQEYWLKTIMEKTGKNKTDAVVYMIQIVYNLLR